MATAQKRRGRAAGGQGRWVVGHEDRVSRGVDPRGLALGVRTPQQKNLGTRVIVDAVDDGVALHFKGGKYHETIYNDATSNAYKVSTRPPYLAQVLQTSGNESFCCLQCQALHNVF